MIELRARKIMVCLKAKPGESRALQASNPSGVLWTQHVKYQSCEFWHDLHGPVGMPWTRYNNEEAALEDIMNTLESIDSNKEESDASAINRLGAKVYKRLAYDGKYKPGECPDSEDGYCYADAPCVYGCDDSELPHADAKPSDVIDFRTGADFREDTFNDVHTALTDRIAEIMSKQEAQGFRNHVTGLYAAIKIVREME